MENYKEKFLIGDYVKGKRTFNGEVIEGKFNGFRLYNKLNPKSVVGVIDTDERCYDVSVDSIELVGSEDKKWRNWLIGHLKGYINQTDNKYAEVCKKAIAWLEKQGEQKPTNKFESKFKVGDWITDGKYTWKVISSEPLDYILQSQNGDTVDDTISYVDEHFHLWTIKDAKDGDVLAVKDERAFIFKGFTDINNPNYPVAYCGIDTCNNLYISNNHYWTDGKVTPSTKEQRDLLFQKMEEAGHEWDAEKKEFREIYQKPYPETLDKAIELYYYSYGNGKGGFDKLSLENFKDIIKTFVEDYGNNPAEWSKEDEEKLNSTIFLLKEFREAYQVNAESCINWLKSIKPQKRWKPSEQNIKDLEWCADLVKDKMGVGFHRLQVFIDELKRL